MYDRRDFLIKSSAMVSLAPSFPGFLASSVKAAESNPNESSKTLVVIQLDGGNDGINTIIPYRDEAYAKYRDELRIAESRVIKLTDEFGFHPRLRSASELFEDGRLSIVHGVGYPNPNRSHFESMAIWQAGSPKARFRHKGNGWLGGAISRKGLSQGPHAVHVGNENLPVALRGRRCTATSIANAEDLQLRSEIIGPSAESTSSPPATDGLSEFLAKSFSDAYTSAEELGAATNRRADGNYPESRLSKRLQIISQLIKSGASARVYYTAQPGYDTHASQASTHANLLGELSSSLKAFMNDLKASGLEDQVLVMAFSEFGRRVQENGSYGTDHGTAGPVLLAGSKLAKPTYGKMPSLSTLEDGDLKYQVDFRDIYAGVVADWLELPLPMVLDGFGMQLFQA